MEYRSKITKEKRDLQSQECGKFSYSQKRASIQAGLTHVTLRRTPTPQRPTHSVSTCTSRAMEREKKANLAKPGPQWVWVGALEMVGLWGKWLQPRAPRAGTGNTAESVRSPWWQEGYVKTHRGPCVQGQGAHGEGVWPPASSSQGAGRPEGVQCFTAVIASDTDTGAEKCAEGSLVRIYSV